MAEFNQAQRLVADTYGGGDYAYITTLDEARDAGDTLFTFLMIELSDNEGCDDLREAVRRLHMAMDQVRDALQEVRNAQV